ncbi:glycosyltransferase family 2 protein [Aestuariibaculum lutulentum]|uniref:Glycosyltransferase n=1 Tax=Aestuariibaculum lutulentum TaxID=2920935 RepID=A0ABS9RGP3_9FLAO|nr:glycosyltransferase family 2 protein [Aestuariibaculum lutulentum]MCH4552110.1 glycosyltransferase [Aestuariibaculum lutulentum]
MQENPLVSIVITSYNQRNQLIRAIESVLNQTYNNIQIVIADDCSTKDDSKDVIKQYKLKYPDKIKPVFQTNNVGISKNKNTGFKACDGDYITYLDGDDFYYKDKIKNEIKVFEDNTWADIVYSNFVFTDTEGKINKQWATSNFKAIEGNIFNEVYARAFPKNTLYRCELTRKGILSSINYYDESLRTYEDWDSRIRMTKTYKVAFSDYVGCAYVQDPSGISKTSKRKLLLEDMKKVYLKNIDLLGNIQKEDRKVIEDKMKEYFSLNESKTKGFSALFYHILNYPLKIGGYKALMTNLLNK